MSSKPVRVNAPSLVRLAGMPARALAAFRFDRTWHAWWEARIAGEQVTSEATLLSDELYAAIGGLGENDQARPGLVGLRRSIHNGRAPREREWNQLVHRTLSAETIRRVEAWRALSEKRDEARARFVAAFTAEYEQKLLDLREVCRDPGFRRGVAVSSPALSAELEKWLFRPDRMPRTQTRLRLMKYLCRSAAKTSLFSALGVAGLVEWVTGQDIHPVSRTADARFVLDLDELFLESLVDQLTNDRELSGKLSVRVNPSIHYSDGKLLFLSYNRYTGVEALESVNATPSLLACLRQLQLAEGYDLDHAYGLLTSGEDSDGKVARYVNRLVEVGLLELCTPVPDTASDPVAGLLDWLDQFSNKSEVTASLRRLKELLTVSVPVADISLHRSCLTALGREISRLDTLVGLTGTKNADPDWRRGKLAHFPFHETAVAIGPVPAASTQVRAEVLDDLERARRLLSAFDASAVVKAAVTGLFAEQYPPDAEVPLLEFYRAACRTDYAGASPSAAALADFALAARAPTPQHWIDVVGRSGPMFRRPETQRLREYWQQVSDLLRRSPVSRGEIVVSADDIDALTAEWPTWMRDQSSTTYYVQALDGDRGSSVVLNEAHSGYGRNRSRIHHLVKRAGGTPEALQRAAVTDGAVLAEFMGTFRGATNRRTAAADHEIEYPKVVTTRNADEVIRLSDLFVARDIGTEQVELRSRSLGKRVIPVHNGMMVPFLLPGLVAWTTWVFGASQFLRTHAFAPLRRDIHRAAYGRYLPRVRVGSVVLFRATWVAEIVEIPRRQPGETDAALLARMWTWAADHGLPERSFARPAGTGDDLSLPGIFPKDRKPLYLDLRNAYSVLNFVGHLRNDGEVMFEEALPDPLDIARRGADACVAELVFELNSIEGPA